MRAAAVVLVGALTAATLAGCTRPGSPTQQPTPTQDAPEPPAISEDEAARVIAELTEVSNKANAARDSSLLATYEAESSLEIDDAVYRVKRVLDPNNANPAPPFQYTLKNAYVPGGSAYPQWFLLDCTFNDGSTHVSLVLSRKAEGEDWKFVIGATNEAPLPDLATDSASNPIAVDPTDGQGLLTSPATIAKAHATYLTEGTAAAEADFFDPADRSEQIIGSKEKFHRGLVFVNLDTAVIEPAPTYSQTVTVAPYPVRALRTRDGGALAIYTTGMEFVAEHPPGPDQTGGR